MRRTSSQQRRTVHRGGTSPTVIVATSAGLLLIAAALWLVWPRSEAPAAQAPPTIDSRPSDPPRVGAIEADEVDSDEGHTLEWPPEEASVEPAEIDGHGRARFGGDRPPEPSDDESAVPREPASAHRPSGLET